jgi:hypothetical protein
MAPVDLMDCEVGFPHLRTTPPEQHQAMNGPNPHYAAAFNSDFNSDLKELIEATRTAASLCERFTEMHGTDCDCIVCGHWQGASNPHETVADVAFLREFLDRQIAILDPKVISSPAELLAALND